MFLLDTREAKRGFEDARERVTAILTKNAATPRVVRKWDERKLAYDVGRQKRATYVIAYFDGGPDVVAKVQRDAELSETILRCLVVRATEIPEKVLKEPFDVAIAPQTEEAPAPPPEVEPAVAVPDIAGAAAEDVR